MRKFGIESTTDSPKKIVYITAGAAGMFCGSCMRDNALVTQLKKTGGYDVTLLPLYTPIRTDEPDVSVDQIFFGGINVFLQQNFNQQVYITDNHYYQNNLKSLIIFFHIAYELLMPYADAWEQ